MANESRQANQSLPNIVLIMADQLAASFVGCYGSGVNSTPTLDRLAADGRRFTRCYATHPICAPNRATLLTGRSAAIHGVISNNYILKPDQPTYAHMLRSGGYRVGGFGKFHVTPMMLPHPANLEYLGFDEAVISEDPKWGAYIDWIEREHREYFEAALAVAWGNPRGELPAGADERYQPRRLAEIRQRILKPLQDASPCPLFYRSPLPAEIHQTAYITDLSLDFMRRQVEQHPGQPFFCQVSYVDPHDPYDPPAPYDTMFKAADMPDPIPAAWKGEGNAGLELSQKFIGFDRMCGSADIVRAARAMYHGSVRFIDDQIARIEAFLRRRGLWGNTIIVFTTDHGDLMGDHELNTKGVKPYDASIRCPLIVAGGAVVPGVTDRLVCSLDFFPSLCDLASVAQDQWPPLEGKSFAPDCRGAEPPARWDAVAVSYAWMSTIISDDNWRLTLFNYPDSPNQLVDLAGDPREQRNRYADPACAAKRQAMIERLVVAEGRARTTPHYRAMPLVAGKKWDIGGVGGGQMMNPIPPYVPEEPVY